MHLFKAGQKNIVVYSVKSSTQVAQKAPVLQNLWSQ